MDIKTSQISCGLMQLLQHREEAMISKLFIFHVFPSEMEYHQDDLRININLTNRSANDLIFSCFCSLLEHRSNLIIIRRYKLIFLFLILYSLPHLVFLVTYLHVFIIFFRFFHLCTSSCVFSWCSMPNITRYLRYIREKIITERVTSIISLKK